MTIGAEGVDGDELFRAIAAIIDHARGRATRAVNSAMVQAYWEIGRQIVLVEQRGARRAGFGAQLLLRLSRRLTTQYGAGFSLVQLKRMRQFYRIYAEAASHSPLDDGDDGQPIGSALRNQLPLLSHRQFSQRLGWSHYRLLMTVSNSAARSFYEVEAGRQGWSSRELERQIASLLFERLAASRDRDGVLALARRGQEISTPRDVVKDPVVLEFLGLPERPHWRERDLEQAIIDHLQEFMLELGRGFCFVARQQRITLGDDHFFVDLVLYNRFLRCFVRSALSASRFAHARTMRSCA